MAVVNTDFLNIKSGEGSLAFRTVCTTLINFPVGFAVTIYISVEAWMSEREIFDGDLILQQIVQRLDSHRYLTES